MTTAYAAEGSAILMSVTVIRRWAIKVFVTGGTGHIGSAVVPELVRAGHRVVALARSDASAQALGASGVEVVRADLADLDALQAGARAADGVVHLAFVHDFADFGAAIATDRAAVQAIGSALEGSRKPFVVAGAIPAVPDRATVESDDPDGDGALDRAANAKLVRRLSDRGIRTAVVRLPHTVHGPGGRGGFTAMLIQLARESGVSGYVGDGSARWPAVPVGDAARLFRLALEEAPAGSVLHAVQDEGVRLVDVADAIGRGLSLPVRRVEPDALGFLGWLATIDKPASSAWTRARFGWLPTGPTLLQNLARGI